MNIQFERFIGIDYSGAKDAETPLSGIRVFSAQKGSPAYEVRHESGRHWSRLTLAHWLLEQLRMPQPTLVGIDHAFSFPKLFLLRHALRDWEGFLEFFMQHMPTHECSIEELRRQRRLMTEANHALRLCESWTASAKSVFLFDVQGSVAKSTYAGLPWLYLLRKELGEKLFFWPFDGFIPPHRTSVICEVYPALYKRRYKKGDMGLDAFDAYAVVNWMQDMQRRDALSRYFSPPLIASETEIARQEGWILGVV
ncbi:MAG: hypothetical protein AB1717_00410 [Pseudomonadota bacterium]